MFSPAVYHSKLIPNSFQVDACEQYGENNKKQLVINAVPRRSILYLKVCEQWAVAQVRVLTHTPMKTNLETRQKKKTRYII